ncbi:MAG TPA: hypothetical protein VFN67_01470 [Polyangiales bacterium]|nr:hypothetical protein [Polyangiales bacterium]
MFALRCRFSRADIDIALIGQGCGDLDPEKCGPALRQRCDCAAGQTNTDAAPKRAACVTIESEPCSRFGTAAGVKKPMSDRTERLRAVVPRRIARPIEARMQERQNAARARDR